MVNRTALYSQFFHFNLTCRFPFFLYLGNTTSTAPQMESNIEVMVLHKQLEQLSSVVKERDNEIDKLNIKIAELQETQGKFMYDCIYLPKKGLQNT